MLNWSNMVYNTRPPWTQFVTLVASCYFIISVLPLSSHVNCAETKASLNLTTCVLTVDRNVYNLSSLVRNDSDQPWQVNTMMFQKVFQKNQFVFINLCRPLPKKSPFLPDGSCNGSNKSAVCLVEMTTNAFLTTSYSDFDQIEATYDHETMEAIHLSMKSSNFTTELYIHCNPSLTNSQPILTDKKSGKFVIEWFHASGCPKEEVIGTDCSVYVSSINKLFDLSPLKKPGGYDFPENGYDYFINVCGPINRTQCRADSGICHYSKDGKMHYSLGQWNDRLTYSDGVLTLTYPDGDRYRDSTKTPRATKIIFICNISVSDGQPDFVAETNHTYIIHWETKHACPKISHYVDCLWQNSTHRIDLSPLSKSEGNHVVVLEKGIVGINVCRPLNNRLHGIPKCPLSSGVCYNSIGFDSTLTKPKSLGQPDKPLQLLFDNQLSLLYSEGDICISDQTKRYATRITFTCDRSAGEGEPTLIEGGLRNCAWLFEWKTNLVCEARPIHSHQCIFEDKLNGLKVDLTRVFSSLPLISEQIDSTVKTFYINLCSGSGKDYKEMIFSKNCINSSICAEETAIVGDTPAYISLGNLQSNSTEYFFQGESLILRFFNGSKCGFNSTWSSEIDIRCSSSSKTSYIRRETDVCIHRFFMESSLVCGLKPPSCTYRVNNSLIDLRELSSLSHAWKAKPDSDGKVYYFNLCNAIPKNHLASDGISSVVECDIVDEEEHCGHPLGRMDRMTMSMESNEDKSKKNLILTYANENSSVCIHNDTVVTKIRFVCSLIHREPKFVRKIDNVTNCEYQFKWETYLACFDHEPERWERPLMRIGNYFFDQRKDIDRAINMTEIFNSNYTVSFGKYEYTFNLAGSKHDSQGNCKNASICQREINGTHERDIGSTDTEMMVTQGLKIKLLLTAVNNQTCGKNYHKNVTSKVFFQCSSSESGIGSPRFYYESNDCDYIFIWETSIVCPSKMLSAPDLIAKLQGKSDSGSDNIFVERSWTPLFGFLIIAFVIVFAVIPLAWIVFRLSDREKRNYLVHWIRSKFRAPVVTSFHYSQVSSDSTKLVSINDDL